MTNNTSERMTNGGWVITKDGIRMSYEEYRDMIEAERN